MIFKITKNNKIIKPKNYKSEKIGIIEKQILRGIKNKDFKEYKPITKVKCITGKLDLSMLNA